MLVIGITRDAAIRLGQQADQNAIVVGRCGREAELVWLSPLYGTREEYPVQLTDEDGYEYVGSKTVRLFLESHGIDDPKNLKIYVESVSLKDAIDESLKYLCSGRAGTAEFSMQPLLVGVKRDRRGGAVAEGFKIVLQTAEPSEYADPPLAPACDLLTALYVIGAGGETFVTKEQISDGAMKQIRKDLRKL